MSSPAWDVGDLNGFSVCTNDNIGQINMDSTIGQYLYNIVKHPSIKNILEIGTWNGLGSTRCIVNGLLERLEPSADFCFYSLECNTEKCSVAQKYYKDVSNVHILNEVILNDMPADIYNIFPEIVQSDQLKYWNEIDYNNMKNKPLFLNRIDVPKMFDMVLLDGGEFTTWYEYLELKDRCKILALDDTNVSKCRRIVEDLKAQPERWEILLDNTTERNGTVIAHRR